MPLSELAPPVRAFDAIADTFDDRFDGWLSVAAQRRAVRAALMESFPANARLIEIGGGTGEDALWMAEQGHSVLMTDASPSMVSRASAKFAGKPGLTAQVACAEALETVSAGTNEMFDGAWSNFAGLNCLAELSPFARGLARLVRPGGHVLLVLFGTCCPGEIIVEALRGRPGSMFRRFTSAAVAARLGGEEFEVRYHRAREVRTAMAPWFSLVGTCGIGVFVPPSAAEPWISRHPGFVNLLEAADRIVSRPLAALGDHLLYHFVRDGGVEP